MTDQSSNIGKVEVVPVRNAFPKEAQHFTTWLERHIDALSDRLRINLTVVQREKAVGDFNVDLLCEDGEGNQVIVENQLERTDHDHLGKLLTYLVNLEAKTAIWLTTEPRPEHHKTIDWLNEATAADISFYLVKVEAIRIGNSPFAPLFTVLSAPDAQTKEIGEKKKEWAERHTHRYEFWKGLLDRSRDKTKLFGNTTPGRYNWISTGAGKSGVTFNYILSVEGGGAELYIDHDHDTGLKNKKIFDLLHAQKSQIEQDFGGPLDWERLDEKRAARIRCWFDTSGLYKTESWPVLQDSMIDAMIRIDKALRNRLAKIDV